MITAAALCRLVPGVTEQALDEWTARRWVRPERHGAEPLFAAIDVARVRLIVELRTEMEVEETSLPLVLSLLDQLYATRLRMRELADALGRDADDALRKRLAEWLGR